MKLTKKQKEMLRYANANTLVYDEEWDSFDVGVLCCLEVIKNYEGLEEDCIKYLKKLNSMDEE